MKNIFRILLLISMVAGLNACEKDENQVINEGGTEPVLTSSVTSGSVIPLAKASESFTALTLNWTNPNYVFNTGISSHDVNYMIEIDTVGANFTNPKKGAIVVSQVLSKSITQGELDEILINTMGLLHYVPHEIEIRVTSYLSFSAAKLSSNVFRYTVTPYPLPKVQPPAGGNLYLVGSATPGGWGNPVPDPAQKFNHVSEFVWELTVNITGGGSYLFLPENGSWAVKYGALGSNNTNNVNGDEFKLQGGDMLAPAASGIYKIKVDFQQGKFFVTQ